MKLPVGVFFRPRQRNLIAEDDSGIIYINTREFSVNKEYQIRNHDFGEVIEPCLKGDWEDFHTTYRLNRSRRVPGRSALEKSLLSRALHRGNPSGEAGRLPDITVVSNLSTVEARGRVPLYTVLGCTMGQTYPTERGIARVPEVYEFQTYGLLVLDRRDGEVELWVAQDGDKVVVPAGCHVTFFNLGDLDHPLVTLHLAGSGAAGPNESPASALGPILLGYYDDFGVVFKLNHLYVNNPAYRVGVVGLPAVRTEQRQIRIPRGGRPDLGRLLYWQLTENPEVIGRFARLDLHIRKATPQAALEPPTPGSPRLYFSQRLVDAVAPGTDVYRYFFPDREPIRPKPSAWRREVGPVDLGEVEEQPDDMSRDPLDRPLVVVVEGAGDWAEDAYRPLFRRQVEKHGRELSVFYCDDTRWKNARPDWANSSGLEDWEVYLDKADPADFACYEILWPDAVFVVTPDFTHSEIARRWIGKTPLIFVEKPFDSHVRSVEDLVLELKDSRVTAVFGLDYYQFYALPLQRLQRLIERHLDYALKEIRFVKVEDRAIELGRVRTLQHGLTLDMLPHFLALLTFFADVRTVDEIRVLEARHYEPLVAVPRGASPEDGEPIRESFRNETAAHVIFTVRDRWDNPFPVPCSAVVGKGFSQEVKYLEVIGHNGNAVRVDFNKSPDLDEHPGYPWDSVFLLLHDGNPRLAGDEVLEIGDPYEPGRILRILEDTAKPERVRPRLNRLRYDSLLEDLFRGTHATIDGTLTLTQGLEVVRALERIWWAVQQAQPWGTYVLSRQPVFQISRSGSLSK